MTQGSKGEISPISFRGIRLYLKNGFSRFDVRRTNFT